MNRPVLVRLVAMILFALLATSTTGCAALQNLIKPPTVRFDKANFKALDFEKLKVDLVFDVTNPNILGAQMEGYDLNLRIDGVTIIDGRVNKKIDLSAGASTDIVVPATLRWQELAKKIGDVASGQPVPKTLPYHAVGQMRFATPIGEIAVPFDIDGKVPVIAPPLVLPNSIKLVRATITELELEVGLQVKNLTGRTVGFAGATQTLKIEGRSVASGKLVDGLSIGANGSKTKALRFTVSTMEVGAALISALTGGGRVDIGFSGRADVDTGFGTVPFQFNVTKDGLRVGN